MEIRERPEFGMPRTDPADRLCEPGTRPAAVGEL